MLKHGFYNIVGEVIRLAFFLASIPILIRILGIEEYGLWKLVLTTVNFITVAEAGLSITTTVFVSGDLAKNVEGDLSQTITITLGLMFILATLVTLLVVLGAPYLVNLFPAFDVTQRQIAAIAIQIGGVVVWTKLIQQILVGLIQAHERFDLLNLLRVVEAVFINVGLVIIAWQTRDVIIMIEWYALISILILGLYAINSKKLVSEKNIRWKWKWEKVRSIGRYSGLVWLTELGSRLFTQVDRLIVASLLGSQTLAIYSTITDVAIQINLFSALPVKPLLPRLSGAYAINYADKKTLFSDLKRVFDLNVLVAFSIGAVLFIWAEQVVTFLLPDVGDDLVVAVLRIVVMIYSLYSVNAIGYFILFGIGNLKANLLVQLVSGIGSLILIWIGAKNFGLPGAAVGNAGYLGVWMLMVFAMRSLKIPTRWWVGWLLFPLAWLFIAIGFSMLIKNGIWLSVGLSVIMMAVFGGWFVKQHYDYLQLIMKKVFQQ